jgi:diaminopimelate decarboxylase
VHARAASILAGLAAELGGVDAIDIGGGIPAAPSPAADAHAAAVARALRAAGFAGRLMLEPGRALVADAVDLACTVVAVKTLADGSACAVLDAGTNLLPGALWAWPRLEALTPRAGGTPALVAGPLCLNIDVVAPAAELGELELGDVLIAREVGAYQQVQSTQFGDLRPAVVVRDGATWRLHRRREQLSDLIIHEREEAPWSA